MRQTESFEFDLADTVYLASILGNQPRSIDRYIDYFGSRPWGLEHRGGGSPSGASRPSPDGRRQRDDE